MLLFAVLAGSAVAGPLKTDPAAMVGWHDSTSFDGTSLHAVVEYAVYAPGQFSSSVVPCAPSSPPFDPSGGSDYVYAYQIINPMADQSYVTELSVGLHRGAVPNVAPNIGEFVYPAPDVNAMIPDSSKFSPSSGPRSSRDMDLFEW